MKRARAFLLLLPFPSSISGHHFQIFSPFPFFMPTQATASSLDANIQALLHAACLVDWHDLCALSSEKNFSGPPLLGPTDARSGEGFRSQTLSLW